MEEFALRSHRLAAEASRRQIFDEMVPAFGSRRRGPRPDTSLEKMAGLTTLSPGGRPDRRRASQISAMVPRRCWSPQRKRCPATASADRPGAQLAVVGSDPVLMLSGPIPATEGCSQGRPDHRRHRRLRGQRGLCERRARLAQGVRRPAGEHERQRRRDRARPPARGHRRPADDQPRAPLAADVAVGTGCRPCARAAGWPTR